mmetsp:Transcript_22162/g.53691  ORF Transcript_22162/g.53691 Transcript_22162/m.53691 type:complete len:195 (+) Transcript_22162:78-662(+)
MTEPNADWSGYAPPPVSKKFIPQPASRIAALSNGTGFGPTKGDEEWHPGRRVSENRLTASSGASILAGTGPSGDWQTEAQKMMHQAKTSREQLTGSGRSMFVSGRKHTIPAHELARPFDENVGARLRDENPYSLNDRLRVASKEENEEQGHPNTPPANDCGYSLVGYRSGGGARSFLEGLGTEVAASAAFSPDE